MDDTVGGAAWSLDAGHSLITVRPELEARLNRKAKQAKQLDADSDAERIRMLSVEVTLLIFKVFRVVGADVQNGCDDTFLKLAEKALDSFDLSVGKPFSYYFRFKYGKLKKDRALKSDQFNRDASSWEDMTEFLGHEPVGTGGVDEWGADMLSTDVVDELSGSELAQQDDAAAEAEFVRLLALVVGFLDHAVDKRDHTPEKKLYTKLFFTESVTRLVKVQTVVEECRPYEKHECEIFSSVELPFQDRYMEAACRAIKEIWRTNLKEGFGTIVPGDFSWHLKSSFIRQYYADKTGVAVSDAAISQQRANYRKFATQCRAIRNA